MRITNKVKDNLKSNKKQLVIFLVIWFLVVLLSISFYKPTFGKESIGNKNKDKVVEINEHTVIEEVAPIITENADCISIMFATYARKNSGSVSITVTGEQTKNIYAEKEISVNNILDNAYITIELSETLKRKNDDKVIIKISSNSEEGNGVGVYYSIDKYCEDSNLKVNSQVNDGELTYSFLVKDDILTYFNNIVVVSLIVVITIVLLIIVLFKPKSEVLFAGLVILFGIFFMFVITPYSGPDEEFHFKFSLRLSNILLRKDEYSINSMYLSYYDFSSFYNVSAGYKNIVEKINMPTKLSPYIKDLRPKATSYFYHLCYLPSAIGNVIGRVVGFNFLRTYYLGRFFNVLFFALCTYLAVRKTPILKNMLGIFALLPMCIQQASIYTNDSFIIGLCLVILGYVLNWYFVDRKIPTKEYVFIFIICAILAPAKIVYSLFTLLFWLAPKERFGGRKQKILVLSIISFPAIIELGKNILLKILPIISLQVFADEGETIATEELTRIGIRYIIAHPVETIKLVTYTIRYSIKMWFYSSIGRTLSGLSLVLPLKLTQCFVVALTLSSVIIEEQFLKLKDKVLFIVSCICCAMLTLATMLVGWTYTTDTMIQGIQGRYFTPFLPYFFATFNNKKLKLPKVFSDYIVFAQILLLFETILYILSYTFVN